ncbi:hypothetical protein H5410_060323 [Solanum commersonii]|uniref:Uncharacterized protein n=1 Tax=Solanum commersonii TaxID=4109 RepID=A0A9J5W4T2_SOLCO|nr:hypothetical protein H5410_060323 [Solanum commersonii]
MISLFVNTWGNEAIYTEFSKWLRNYVYDEYSSVQHLQLVKEVALGPQSQVLAMNKYYVNGFKFQTEEVSRNKKTNNSGVYIQGDVDGIGQTIEYYGVIQEIIEVSGDRHPRASWISLRLSEAKKKKSRRPIDHEDIARDLFLLAPSASHDTHLFVVPLGMADPRNIILIIATVLHLLHGIAFTTHEDLPLQAIHRARPLSCRYSISPCTSPRYPP